MKKVGDEVVLTVRCRCASVLRVLKIDVIEAGGAVQLFSGLSSI